jgi:hypothetical protein
MFYYLCSLIVADPSGIWEKQIDKIGDYISHGGAFLSRMAADHPNEFLTAISTAVIAAFTTVLAIFTIRLWRAGERHSERELRAYISIERSARSGPHRAAPRFDVGFQNRGQTPAYNGRYWVDIQIHECPLKTELVRSGKETVGTFEIPPGNAFTLASFNDNEIATLPDLQNPDFTAGKSAFYVFGQLDFVDAFGKTRWLKFRTRYDIECVSLGELHVENIQSN